MRLFFSDDVAYSNLPEESPCKLGRAQSSQSEATQRSLPVVRLNLRVLRVRDDDEGFEVRWVEQRVSQVDANPVYYVFGHSWSCDAMTLAHDQLRVMQKLSCYSRLREKLVSRVTSSHSKWRDI